MICIYILSSNNHLGKIDIFDFAMDKVKHLNNSHFIGNEVESIWDGRNEVGDQVANGVYFSRLNMDGKYYWTKVVVVN